MKTAFPLLFTALSVGVLLHASPAAADESTTSKRFDIETLTGNVYKDSRVIKITPADLTIMHDSGVAKISFDNLSASWREKFGYTEEKAEAYLARQDEMKKEAEEKAKAAYEKRDREERLFIAKVEAEEKKRIAADAALFPPTLAPLPGEDVVTSTSPTTAMPSAFDLVPKTTPLGATHDPGFRTRSRSWRVGYGDGILTYDGYYPPNYGYGYGYGYGWYSPPPVYCPPHHHHHGYRSSGGFTGRSVIRITR